MLLHLVDASDRDPDRQIVAVRQVLREIGAEEVGELLVINKIDIATEEAVRRLKQLHPEAVAISARTGEGLDALAAAVQHHIEAGTVELELMIPYDHGEAVAAAHRAGEVLKQDHDTAGTRIYLRVAQHDAHEFEPYVVG